MDKPKVEIRSYFAVVRSRRGFLLGGCLWHQSSRFALAEQAAAWADNVIEINNGRPGFAGDAYLDGPVRGSSRLPEIDENGALLA